jgi:hypothetical protein
MQHVVHQQATNQHDVIALIIRGVVSVRIILDSL